MRINAVLTVWFIVISGTCSANAATLPDVETFIKNAERCEQVALTWDRNLSAKKKREIERALGRYCATAQRQLKAVSLKYKDDPEVQKLIAEHSFDSVRYFTK